MSVLLLLCWRIIAILLIDNIPSFEANWNPLSIIANFAFGAFLNFSPINCGLHLSRSCPTDWTESQQSCFTWSKSPWSHLQVTSWPSRAPSKHYLYTFLYIEVSLTHLQVDVLCHSWPLSLPTQEGREARSSPCSHCFSSNVIRSLKFTLFLVSSRQKTESLLCKCPLPIFPSPWVKTPLCHSQSLFSLKSSRV